MVKRRYSNPALRDALAHAFGRPQSHVRETSKSHGQAACENDDIGSASLKRFYEALASANVNDGTSSSLLIPLAIDVARRGLQANVRPAEAHIITSLIHTMGEMLLTGAPGSAERSDLVLGMACLVGGKSGNGEVKKNFAKILAQAVLAGRLRDDFEESVPRNTKEWRLLRNALDVRAVKTAVLVGRHEGEERRREEESRLKEIEDARRNAILEIRGRVSRIRSELFSFDASPEIQVEPLRLQDIQLVLKWGSQTSPDFNELTLDAAHSRLGGREFTRLCSARSAELAAAKFYSALGAILDDVAVKQLEPHNNDWRTHDLRVDGRPIDVKNARQSFSDPSRYSEYLVPRFKEDRRTGHDVTIVAVLSRYMTAAQIKDATKAECTILGEVKQEDLDRLAHWANSSFDGLVSTFGSGTGGRLPGWCFEYQWRKRPTISQFVQKVNDLIQQLDVAGLSLREVGLSTMFLAFCDDRRMVEAILHDSRLGSSLAEELEMWERLAAMRKSVGWSRRTLFLFVIGYTLVQLKTSVGDWSPRRLNEWLFVDATPTAKYWPLGLYDPLGYVAGIIDAMGTLWSTSRKLLENFVSFRMMSPWILKGVDSAGNETTIMAYCGGWVDIDQTRKTKCGLSPLVIGKDASCPVCRRLICHSCDFCSEECERMTLAKRKGW